MEMIIISLLFLYLCLWVVACQWSCYYYAISNDHDYYKIIYCIIQYVQSHDCISNIFCRSFLYESCVSIKFISSSSVVMSYVNCGDDG